MKKELKKLLFQQLAEDDELLELLQEISLDGLWIWNLNDTRDYWLSPGYYKMLGFSDKPKRSPGSPLSDRVYPKDIERVEKAIQEHIQKKTTHYDIVFRMRDFHNDLGWYRIRGVFIEPRLKQEKYLIGTSKALPTTDKINPIFRKTINASAEAIYVLLAHYSGHEVTDFVIRDINQKAEQELSMSRSDLIGGKINGLFPVNLENGYFERYKNAFLTGQTDHQEYSIPEGLPGAGDYQNTIVPYSDGVIIYNQDITELKRTTSDLEQVRKEMSALDQQHTSVLSTQSVYVVKTDMEGNFTYLNDYFLRKFDFDRQTMMGTNSMDTIFIEDHNACYEVIQRCFAEPEVFHPVILRKMRHDGRIVSSKWEFRGLTDHAGVVPEILCVGFDITEQVEALAKAEKLVDVTTDQNNRLRSFAYIVSHNIRSHSSNIKGLTNLLVQEKGVAENEYFKFLRQSTDMLNRTISHLSQIMSVQLSTNQLKKDIHLLDEVKNTMIIFKNDLQDIDAIINLQIPEDFTVRFVPSYLESILLNLLSNAIKYRQPGRSLKVLVKAGTGERKKYFSVEDNGRGMDLSQMGEQLFGMYKTFHGNEDAQGFGLFLTRSQVEAMDGRIEVESKVGLGSKFTIWLNGEG